MKEAIRQIKFAKNASYGIVVVRYSDILCNVITKFLQYDDQFRPSRDPDYLNALSTMNLCDLVT